MQFTSLRNIQVSQKKIRIKINLSHITLTYTHATPYIKVSNFQRLFLIPHTVHLSLLHSRTAPTYYRPSLLSDLFTTSPYTLYTRTTTPLTLFSKSKPSRGSLSTFPHSAQKTHLPIYSRVLSLQRNIRKILAHRGDETKRQR